MNNSSLPYDDSSLNSILNYALQLLNKSLSDVIEHDLEKSYRGKGSFGQKVEKLYFKYEPNSKSEPDFSKVGMELKTTPLKEIKKGFVSKERLVFNSIDYATVFALAPVFKDYYVIFFGFEINVLTLICFFFFIGATGKSAQVGLHT